MKDLSTQEMDVIGRKMLQLRALLSVSMSKEFTTYSDKVQSAYLWACFDLADEIDQMLFPNCDSSRGYE